jgi:hypothetical protein
LEGGIDEGGSFHHIPIKDTSPLAEVFRRRVLKLFVDRGLLDPQDVGSAGEDRMSESLLTLTLHVKYFPGSTQDFRWTTQS